MSLLGIHRQAGATGSMTIGYAALVAERGDNLRPPFVRRPRSRY